MAIAFNGIGLSSLTYNGTQFLSYGDLRLDQVTFVNPDQSTTAGSTASMVSVDPVRQIQTRTFSWGTMVVGYTAGVNRLNMTVTVTNNSSLPIQQIWFEALGLLFPSAVQNYDGVDPIITNTLGQPAVLTMNYGSGVLAVSADNVVQPIQIGFPYAFSRPANNNFPLTLNTGTVSSYPNSFPFINRPIAAGASDQYQFSLRFGPPGSTAETLAPDTYQAFAAAFPPSFNWPDRRPIGQIIIATAAAGYPLNPRGWFLNPYEDVTTPAGVAKFQSDLLSFAATSIGILQSMGAQGMITWDIEGEQYPQPITYAGDPRQFAAMAPEMANVADQYFAMFRNAGFRVGVCIRPQNLVISPDGSSAQQIALTDPTQILIAKASYAHSRWGATLFYIDSNVNATDPNPIPPGIIQTLSLMFPDSLFIPEHSVTQYFAYSAPYREVKQGYTSTPADARFIYPHSFTVLYTADGPLSQDFNALVTSVSQGDVLLYRSWFADPQNQQVLSIYNAAHPGTAVSVSVSPQTGTLSAGQTLQLGATVSGSPNQQVSWTATLGTVSQSGLYSAPASLSAAQTATVTATSQADATKSASAVLTITPAVVPVVTVTPLTASVSAGQSVQFGATVANSSSQQVNWTATLGTISAGGLYTAPASVSSVQTVTIRATSGVSGGTYATATVTVNPAAVVSVAVSPQSATLAAGQTILFSATVSGSSNQQVTWSTNVGSVSSAGLYTAPATVPAAQTAIVTATSVADPTKFASASVTLNPKVAVVVTPSTGTLTAGQILQFTATVSGSSNQQVTWSANIGTVSSAGLYTAPAAVSASQTATVTATSVADPTKSASAVVTLNSAVAATCGAPAVNAFTGCYYQDRSFGVLGFTRIDPQINFNWLTTPPGLGVGPDNFTVRWTGYFAFSAASYTFTLTTDDGSRLWIDGQLTIDNWGEHPAIPYSVTVPVTAGLHLLQVDYEQLTGAASTIFSWSAPATVTITPATASVGAGQTVQFAASVTGNTNQQVTWSAAVGTISASGLYTPPASIASSQTVTVVATSVADPTKSASATITLTPAISVSVTPATGSLVAGQTLQFAATVAGSANQQVTWSAAAGTISASGLYIAPASVPYLQTVTVVATSVADPTKSASATITLNSAISISVTPATGSLVAGQTLQFAATVAGSANPQVTWSTAAGSISASGLFTAPASIAAPQTVTVIATSVADPTKSASATITLNPAISVSLTPAIGSLTAGQTLQLTATVAGSANQQVTWTASVGTVSASGLYTAPASLTLSQTATVTATSLADPTKSASAIVTLTPAVVATCGTPSVNAFTGCYYQDRSFGVLGFTRVDPQINFNWNAAPPGQGVGPLNFTVRWLGTFNFAAGNYAFTLTTDDGSRLWVDGVLTIDWYSEHPAVPLSKMVALTAGSHLIQVDYFQLDGSASALLTWAQQ